jgi:HD-like signal output (HDOD) protein
VCLRFPLDSAQLAAQEREHYGHGHAEVGAQVLARWNFPRAMCALIAHHHDDLTPDATPLARVLAASRTCADLILRENGGAVPGAEAAGSAPARTPDRLPPSVTPAVLDRIRERAEPLRHSLTASG